jgi:dienelactone hydrolase
MAFHFAPSENHRRLLEAPPRLAFSDRDAESPAAVRRFQARLRKRVASLVGLHRIASAGPLRPRRLFRREVADGTVEKLVFTSERGADVPAYLCIPHRPAGPAGKRPFMICLQGHSSGMHNSVALDAETERVEIDVEGDRDFARQCLRRGVAALCIEQRSLGERAETKQARRFFHNGCHDAAMRALMLGRTLLGERIFDVSRALDLLAARDDVGRIGIMGNSGGGAVALYAAALLPRIDLVAPSCALCTFRASILSIYHCSDNYVPGLALDAELADIAGLVAPRPLIAVAGRTDEIFPLTGARACFRNVKKVYRAVGAEHACRLLVGPKGHRFYADLAWPAILHAFGEP